MTAEEIRERISGYDQDSHEAFRRAFERDKQELRDMGIPIDLTKTDPWMDQADGYTIEPGEYYLPQIDLEPDEIAALNIVADAVLGSGQEAEAGFMKLSLEAPQPTVGAPRVLRGADISMDNPYLTAAFTALAERVTLRIDYTTGEGIGGTRTIEPYGLVHRRGHWYLVARDTDKDAIRSFKVSRISDLSRLELRYEIPAGFDAQAHLAGEAWEIGPGEVVEAQVRFDPSIGWWAQQNLPGATKTTGTDETVVVAMKVANVDALVSWALGFGEGVEIVGPPIARQRMLEVLEPFLEEGT